MSSITDCICGNLITDGLCANPFCEGVPLKSCCKHCDDGEGNCMYPQYGMAPHKHMCDGINNGIVIDDKKTWPPNFEVDSVTPPNSGWLAGTYTHCLECGRPNDIKQGE